MPFYIRYWKARGVYRLIDGRTMDVIGEYATYSAAYAAALREFGRDMLFEPD